MTAIGGEQKSRSMKLTKPASSEEDQQLENAASIGTSLMLVNSHRALFMMYVHTTTKTARYDVG
jgi:hypothetical protein